MRLLPLNVQSFRRMREDDNIYVDKTALIHRLAQSKNNFFQRGEALQRVADQIVRKDYAAPWLGGTKRVIAVAVAIDDATRNISGWKVVDL